MPDLNYRSSEVTQQMYQVVRFWLEDMRVDGFRLDAVQHLIEDGRQQAGTAETHAWLADFQRFTNGISPDALTVGEVWADTIDVAPYTINDELDLVFEFSLAQAILESVGSGSSRWLRVRMQTVLDSYPPGRYATFLTNHDQNRVMTSLGRDPDRARLAATILLTLPGVPFIYYGEEIGMIGKKPDERIRTPMQWTADEHAGFTTGRPWEPVNDDYGTVNVEAQSTDPDSLLSHYRQLIRVRNDHVALRTGSLLPLETACRPVYSYLRQHEEEAVLVILNFADGDQTGCTFSLARSPVAPGTYAVRQLLTDEGADALTVGEGGGFSGYVPFETLSPTQGYVLLLQRGA
jgi:glycosidase